MASYHNASSFRFFLGVAIELSSRDSFLSVSISFVLVLFCDYTVPHPLGNVNRFFQKSFYIFGYFSQQKPANRCGTRAGGVKKFSKKVEKFTQSVAFFAAIRAKTAVHRRKKRGEERGKRDAGAERGAGGVGDGTCDVPLRGLRTFAAAFCLPCVLV